MLEPQSSERPFSQVLISARKREKLSQSELARRTGLYRGTIKHLEEGKHEPSAETRRRIEAVLRLDGAPPATAQQDWTSTISFSQRYDPLQLARDMVGMLNGPGGTMEQTFAYLDPQSADDWYQYCNQPLYLEKYKAKIPVHPFAKVIAQRVPSGALDLIALGSGDGKTETRLAQALVERLPPASLRTYLVDISHPLLVEAFNHSQAGLPPDVAVFPIHGNFLDLGRILSLRLQPGRERPRLWTMFGNTFGNLAHEPSFINDLGACTRPGDLMLLDVQLTWASAQDLTAVRKVDPAFQHGPDDGQGAGHPALGWLKGPILRHSRGLIDARIELSVTNRCPLPGSYEINFTAHVTTVHGKRQIDLFRMRRYDLALLGREVADMGWVQKKAVAYGPAPEHMALLLLEKR